MRQRSNPQCCRRRDGAQARVHNRGMQTPALNALSALQTALNQLNSGELDVPRFATIARQQPVLLAALPPRFTEVLHDLLDRLESSALFTEESCSFSQHTLTGHLQQWIDTARGRLPQA